jgi:hypothetical protein
MAIDPSIITQGLRPLPQINPLEIYSQVAQVAALRDQAEARRQAAEEARTKAARQRQIDDAYAKAVRVNPETNELDIDYGVLTAHLPGAVIPEVVRQLDLDKKTALDLRTGVMDLAKKRREHLVSAANTIAAAGYDPLMYGVQLKGAHDLGALDDETYGQLRTLSDPAQIQHVVDGFRAQAAKDPVQVETVNERGERVTKFVTPTPGAEYVTAPKVGDVPSFQDVDATVTLPDGKTFTGKVGFNPKTNDYAPIGSTTPFPPGTKVERAPTPVDPTVEAIRGLTLSNLQRNQGTMTPAQFSMASRLADDYTAASKNYIIRAQAYQTLKGAADNPSAAGDIVMIFAFMRLQDPTSTVREGEFATAQNAAGVPDRIRVLYNKALAGERLSPAQRADFVDQSARQFRQAQQEQRGLLGVYSQRAQRANLNPADVVIDYDQVFGLPVSDQGGGGGTPREGETRPIPGYPNTEQTYRNGKWIRTK